jgi:hypothetical protein
MKDLLHRGLAISKKKVHAFTGQAARAERRGGGVTDAHQVRGSVAIDVGEVSGMPNRDDEKMTGIHRLDVHERGASIVAIDEASRELSLEDAAKDTLTHCLFGSTMGKGICHRRRCPISCTCWLSRGGALQCHETTPPPSCAAPAAKQANGPTFEARVPTFEARVPTFEANDPTLEANDPTFEANDPTFEANLPTLEGNAPTSKAKRFNVRGERANFERERANSRSERAYSAHERDRDSSVRRSS